MVFIKFEGFMLGFLLVSFALQNPSVYADRQERRLMEANSVKESQENDASFTMELIDGGLKEAKIGGRKMGMMLKKDDEEMGSRSSIGDHAQKLNVEADKYASKEGPQDFLNNQKQGDALEKMTMKPNQSAQKSKNEELNVANINEQDFSHSVASPSSSKTKKISPEEYESEEWRKLLEEADKKVMQMMRKDYSGMRRPRRKPPINNCVPNN